MRYGHNAPFDKEHRAARKEGRKVCRMCGQPITAPRRLTVCGAECETAIRLLFGINVRAEVWKRDHGICAICGTNTCPEAEPALPLWRFEATHGPSGKRWHADHIVPVVEGGGQCGIDNLRTLCVDCHKRETAALAARRAKPKTQQRRAAEASQLPLMEAP